MLNIVTDIEQLRSLLNPEFLRKAHQSALKATQSQTATQVSRAVRARYNVTQKAIAARLKMGLADEGRTAYLRWIGSRIGLIEFDGKVKKVSTERGKRFGATARISKDKPKFLAKGGFIAKGANDNTHIFRRIDQHDNKSKIRRMAGPAIAQMVGSKEVFEDAQRFVAEKYPVVLHDRLKYFLDQQAKK